MSSKKNYRASSSATPAFRVWQEDSCKPEYEATNPPLLQNILRQFEETTGWVVEQDWTAQKIKNAAARPGGKNKTTATLPTSNWGQQAVRASVEQGLAVPLYISDLSAAWPAGKPAVHRQKSETLLAAIDDLWQAYQHQTRRNDAAQIELGSGSVMGVRCNEIERLAVFLKQLLATAAEQTGYDSAAAFAIDDQRQLLVQRLGTGNFFGHSLGMTRELKQCLGDQQALLGSVVVMGSPAAVAQWGCPVAARSALCLPISSMSQLLGTLWFASSTGRLEPSSEQTNLLELLAGRIAAEWERVALIKHLLNQRDHSDDSAKPNVWTELAEPTLAELGLDDTIPAHPLSPPKASADSKLPVSKSSRRASGHQESAGKLQPRKSTEPPLSNPEQIVGRLLGRWAQDISGPVATQNVAKATGLKCQPTLDSVRQPQPPFAGWQCRGAWFEPLRAPRASRMSNGTQATRGRGSVAHQPKIKPPIDFGYAHVCQWNVTPQETLLTWCVAAENDKLSIDRSWWQELFQTLSCWAAKPAELITAAAERYRRLGWLTEERTVDPVQIVIAEFDPLTGEYAWSGQGRWRLQSNRMTKSQLKPKQNPHGRGVLRGKQSLQFVLPRSNRSNAKLLTLLQVTREGERI